MAKPRIEVNVAGTWKTVTQPEVKVSGIWEPVLIVKKNISGGAIQMVYASPLAITVTSTLTGATVGTGSPMIAQFLFGHDGTIFLTGPQSQTVQLNVGEWHLGQFEAFIGGDYQIRETAHAGEVWQLEASPINTYITLDDNRIWQIGRNAKEGIGTTSASGTFQIRDKASPFAVLTTFTFAISVERTA